jgi:hypothetical protein
MQEIKMEGRKFLATLIRIDEPSDQATAGSRGHKIMLTRYAVNDAINQLENSNLYASECLTIHDQKRVVGTIKKAWINKKSLCVCGSMLEKEADRIDINCSLAMSADMKDCSIEDIFAPLWVITKVNFIGGTVLKKGKQAYKKTKFRWIDDQ